MTWMMGCRGRRRVLAGREGSGKGASEFGAPGVVHGTSEARPTLQAADRLSVDALCVGTHGVSGLKKALMSSVTQEVMAMARTDRPVLVVTLSLCSSVMSVPSVYRLYLPESWAADAARRRTAGIPAQVHFQPKWEIALWQVDTLLEAQLPLAPVVADAGYGDVTAFREALTARGLSYAVPYGGMGRPPKRLRRLPGHEPVSVQSLALSPPEEQWRSVQWREGTKGTMQSRFARLRVRAAHRDYVLLRLPCCPYLRGRPRHRKSLTFMTQ